MIYIACGIKPKYLEELWVNTISTCLSQRLRLFDQLYLASYNKLISYEAPGALLRFLEKYMGDNFLRDFIVFPAILC